MDIAVKQQKVQNGEGENNGTINGNMVIIMLVGYAILGFIIFHNIFDVFYFDLGRGLLM